MKTNKDFDFGMWLKNRSEKESTKTVNFSDLTKKEKVETLLNLLGKEENEFLDVQILGTEERQFADCSAQARAAVLQDVCNRLARGEKVDVPNDKTVVSVPIKTGFLAASLVAKINYLSGIYEGSLETVTVNVPCGEKWVNDLKSYILAEAEATK